MPTVLAIVAGLLLLGMVMIIAGSLGLNSRTTLIIFAVLWLIASIVHGVVGVAAGQTVLTQAWVWTLVFGVPMGTLLMDLLREMNS